MSRRGENIYKRKDGRWEGRYVRNRRLDGSIHYGYVYARSYTELKLKLIPLKISNLPAHHTHSVERCTVQEWFTRWVKERKSRWKLSTLATYEYKIQKYILPEIGQLDLSELSKTLVQNLVITWEKKYELSAATISAVFQILRKAVVAAYKNGHLAVDSCEEIILPKKKKKRIRALSQEEQNKLEDSALKNPNGLPVLLALCTGLRIGEISALSWNDIDLENQSLYVQNTYQRIQNMKKEQRTSLLMSDAKSTASYRNVPLSETLTQLLQKEKLRRNGATFLFTCNNRPKEPRLINYHFKKIIQKAGLENIHFHQLRHTFATRCMEANGDIASISNLLGHSSVKTTMDVYVDSLDKQRRKIISDMDQLVHC